MAIKDDQLQLIRLECARIVMGDVDKAKELADFVVEQNADGQVAELKKQVDGLVQANVELTKRLDAATKVDTTPVEVAIKE